MNTKYTLLTALFAVVNAVDQTEVAKTNITLQCNLSGNVMFPTWEGPPSSTIYIQEGQEMNANFSWASYGDDNKTLELMAIKPQYSGGYTCRKDGNSTETINLNVLSKPDVLLENKVDAIYDNFIRNQVLQGLEDKNISVTCIAKGGNPAPNVEITVNSTTIDDIDLAGERNNTSVKESDNTYTVQVSRKFFAKRSYDRTEVVCTARNPSPSNKLGNYSTTDMTSIYLKLKPALYALEGPGSINEGANGIFICSAIKARPAPTISWLFDGQPTNTSKFIASSTIEEPQQTSETVTATQNLTIVRVEKEDNKKILECVVKHEALDEPGHVNPKAIDVNFGPDYVNITGNENKFAEEGASLTLTCSTATMGTVSRTGDHKIIYWRNDTDLKIIANNAELTYTVGEYSGTKVSQNLTINITRYMNGRTLTCFVYRQSETSTKVSATVTLDIDYPPVINDPEDAVVRFAVHDNASLRCSANSKPPSNFTWYEVGNNVALAAGAGTTERNEFNLHWPDIGFNISGKYKCVATNKAGYTDEREVEVLITEEPKVPENFNFFGISSDQITVSYTPPADATDIYQNYYVQYRASSANNTMPWHEVVLPLNGDFELKNLKFGTEYELRIKVMNKYGSARYTETRTLKTQGVDLEDGINRKDLDVAIAVSVVVTAVVIEAFVAVIYVCRRKHMCGSSSEKFELQTR